MSIFQLAERIRKGIKGRSIILPSPCSLSLAAADTSAISVVASGLAPDGC